MATSGYLRLVEELYLALDERFDEIYQQSTADERLLLRAVHAAARDAYWKGVVELLEDDNAVVEQIATELREATRKLKTQLERLTQVAATLSVAANAVRLAGSLVTLAAA